MDNPKIVIGKTKFGKGLFAKERLEKNEPFAEFDGPIYEAERCSNPPQDVADHAIQIDEHKWKDSQGIARFINHSCEPNCGISGNTTLVALRDIQPGEELLWDYEMTEDSDWHMECHCGTPSCRHTIGAFRNMPENIRQKYRGYIADWLVKKYEQA